VITLEVLPCDSLGLAERQEIIDLCTAAFDEDFARLFELLPGSRHILLRDGGVLVSHACWVTRWLQPVGLPLLRTAYIEAVATHPQREGKGLGSQAMELVAAEIAGYDLARSRPRARPSTNASAGSTGADRRRSVSPRACCRRPTRRS
jgi:aminoglycoside 2'-N-acetyltransferase I